MNFDGTLTEYEQQIIDGVDKQGCFVVSVLPTEDSDGPTWTYSIGFTKSLGQPEVVFCGLPGELAQDLVNDLYAMVQQGRDLRDGQTIEGLVANFGCIARTVDESWLTQHWFASALWYHRRRMERGLKDVVQIVWPDPEHNFPWHDGCADWVLAEQLAMYEPRPVE